MEPNYVVAAMARFASYGDREAMVHNDRRLSYADVRRDVVSLARSLRRHGVTPGEAIAVLAGSKPNTILLQLAMHLLGCRTVWIAGYAPASELADYLARAQADVFIYDTERHSELAARLLGGDGGPTRVLCLGQGGAGTDLLDGRDPTQSGPSASDHAEADLPAVDLSDVTTSPQALFYTGGTTGRPKLVHHEHRFFLALLAIGEAWLASGSPALRHQSVTGFSHVSGNMTSLLMLFTGSTIIMKDAFDIPDFLASIAREKVTSTLVTPVQLYQILDHPALAEADLSSLFLLNIGGAPTTPARLRQAVERFGPIVRLTYGLSEAAFITEYRGMTIDPDHPQRLASCGYLFADSKVQIRDRDGTECPPGTVGEVWVSGSLVMSGYWGEPELTRQVLVDGWLFTEDIGYLDEDGFLYLVDRAKDMIITGVGAANVYTRSVENVLTSHPSVLSAAVIGVPDPELGEAVCAFVVTRPGATVGADELRTLIAEQLKPYCSPHLVRFVDSLPLTGMGKVDKKELRAWYDTAMLAGIS